MKTVSFITVEDDNIVLHRGDEDYCFKVHEYIRYRSIFNIQRTVALFKINREENKKEKFDIYFLDLFIECFNKKEFGNYFERLVGQIV